MLFAVALVLRAAVVWAVASEHAAPVTYEHGAIARNLLEGRGFSVWFLGSEGPTSQQAPLYPAMLAGLYWLLGIESPAAILAMQLLQCVAGAAIPLCVCWLSWSLLPAQRGVGWWAGWGAAVYPTHVYMSTHIQIVTWATLVLTLLAAVVLAHGAMRPVLRAMFAGILSGVVLLLDPILAVALPVLALAIWAKAEKQIDGDAKRRAWCSVKPLLPPAVMAATAAVVIAPWLWRNYLVHGEVVFVKSSFGYAFWQANNPCSWGTDKIPKPSAEALRRNHDGSFAGIDRAMWEARHETIYIDDLLLKPGRHRQFAGLNEPSRSRLLMEKAKEFIADHPEQYARLCAQRLRYFLLFDETNPKAANPLYRLTTVIWLTLAVLGLAVACRRDESGNLICRRLWPTIAIFFAVMLFHTLTIVSARFRIPVEPLTFVWCALAVDQAVSLFTRSRESHRAIAPLPEHRPHQRWCRPGHRSPVLADQR